MAAFCTDENVPLELSDALRALGHDVLTIQADGRASRGIDDPDVLARAIELGPAVITNNRWDYHRLHRTHPKHSGIITYTEQYARKGRRHARGEVRKTLATEWGEKYNGREVACCPDRKSIAGAVPNERFSLTAFSPSCLAWTRMVTPCGP